MAVISRPHAGGHSVDFSGLARGLIYLMMAIAAIVIAVPAAIATAG